MGRKKSTKEEFIAKAISVHSHKYNYDKVEYVNAHTPIIITCPVHRDFLQRIDSHLRGCGCPHCAKEAKTNSKEEFITKAKAVHGNRYDYSKVEYINNYTPLTITCPIHGDFEMLPNNHTSMRQGCPHCAKEAKTMAKEEFVEKARTVHGDKYDYTKVEYTNAVTPVTIICQKHGDFLQTPNSHISGKEGCPCCARERNLKAQTMTTEEFTAKAKAVHGNRYDYSKIEYINNHTQVTIICPKHGDFSQLPTNHLGGSGCPYCKSSHLETKTRILLEQNGINSELQKKFPWLLSNKNYPMRLDFYLPEYNIAIECQGEQHYAASGTIFTEEKVGIIKQRDKLKYELCQQHSIPIYYIRYDDNVEVKINDLLISLTDKK